MPDKTFNFTLSDQVTNQIDNEIESGDFANANEWLNNLVTTYFERKRVIGLVAEGLADKNRASVDWSEMEAELEAHIQQTYKEPVK